MKIMQISVNIDVTNADHVEALERFTRALGGLPVDVSTGIKFVPMDIDLSPLKDGAEDEEVEDDEESPEERKKRERRERAQKRKELEAKLKAEEDEDEDDEDDDSLLGDEEEEEEKITVAELRTLTARKVADHKSKVKEKLTALGASNVSSLAEKHYSEYKKFLNSLD